MRFSCGGGVKYPPPFFFFFPTYSALCCAGCSFLASLFPYSIDIDVEE